METPVLLSTPPYPSPATCAPSEYPLIIPPLAYPPGAGRPKTLEGPLRPVISCLPKNAPNFSYQGASLLSSVLSSCCLFFSTVGFKFSTSFVLAAWPTAATVNPNTMGFVAAPNKSLPAAFTGADVINPLDNLKSLGRRPRILPVRPSTILIAPLTRNPKGVANAM